VINYIKDNWKWVLTTIISIAAVVPAWLVINFNNKKALSYDIQSISPLITEDQALNRGIKILFDNKEVTKPYVSVIKLINTGGIPIEKIDYDGPIIFETGQNTRLLSVSIIDKLPLSITTNTVQNGNTLQLMPTLLNPEDSIYIKLITGDNKPKFNVRGRISGIKELTQYGSNNKMDMLALFIFTIGAVLYGIAYAVVTTAFILREKGKKYCLIPIRAILFIYLPIIVAIIPVIKFFTNRFGLNENVGFFFIWFCIASSGHLICFFLKLYCGRKEVRGNPST
jgi:hypothetical protein